MFSPFDMNFYYPRRYRVFDAYEKALIDLYGEGELYNILKDAYRDGILTEQEVTVLGDYFYPGEEVNDGYEPEDYEPILND
jgi:hypothetical protein